MNGPRQDPGAGKILALAQPIAERCRQDHEAEPDCFVDMFLDGDGATSDDGIFLDAAQDSQRRPCWSFQHARVCKSPARSEL